MATPENSVVFSLEEKGRIRGHLGYLVVNPVVTMQLGVPAVSQTGFLLEAAMDRVPASQAGLVRSYLANLEAIDQRLLESIELLQAQRLGDITLNPDTPDLIEKEKTRWAMRLADLLGVPLNPFSSRWSGAGKTPLNGPVFNG